MMSVVSSNADQFLFKGYDELVRMNFGQNRKRIQIFDF